MSRRHPGQKARIGRVAGAFLLVLLSPVVVAALVAYGAAFAALHLSLWIFWGVGNRRVLFVYSDSPVWREHIEANLLPRLPPGSVVLNWSQRRHWKRFSLAYAAFRMFGGRREFNPLALVIVPFKPVRRFRFWRAFKDAKRGEMSTLRSLEEAFFARLDDLSHGNR